MDNEMNKIELAIETETATAADTEAKVAEILAPELNFDNVPVPTVAGITAKDEEDMRQETFTPEEQRQIDEFAEKIKITDSSAIINYGAGAQQKLTAFSDSALAAVKTKELDGVGELLGDLVADMKFDVDGKKKGGLFKRSANKIEALRAGYAEANTNIEKVCELLQNHQTTLFKDVAMLDQLYDKNKIYFKELSMYIAAGKQALDKARAFDLVELQDKAANSGLAEDAQSAQDFAAMCDRFEKKLADLEITRTICLQNAPQIRMIQNNDVVLADKIQSALVNTIPLWKNQMVIALGMAHSENALRAQEMVTDATNEMLKKNADMLHDTTVRTAEANERTIVDIETLQHTNEQLIATIDEVIQIQKDGKAKRAAAEVELAKIESDLKAKMLEASGRA